MIELLIGAAAGAVLTLFGRSLRSERDRDAARAENREFRTALRHIRGITARYPDLRSIANYVDAVLNDEAGA